MHLALAVALAASAENDIDVPAAFASEDFSHCCWPKQLAGVIEGY
jgi:hypothetical protein